MNETPVADSAYLSSISHSIESPFRIRIHLDAGHTELTCTRALRILPGKRLVFAGEKNTEKVVLKIFLDPKNGRRHCTQEERGIRALKTAGIHVPHLISGGALDAAGRQPVLVFKKIDRAVDFADAWVQEETDSGRLDLLKRLASVTARMHEAGLIHKDAHPGNFMISGDLIYAVDGAAVSVRNAGKPLYLSGSLKNLGAFFAQIAPGADHLLDDAFRAYLKQRGWGKSDLLTAGLKKQIRIHRKKREKKYLKKIYRASSANVCSKTWTHFMVCDRSRHTRQMARLLSKPDRFLDSSELIKKGNSSTVALVDVGGHRMVVKRYNIKNIRHALSRCPRPSRAWHSWKNAHRMRLLEISTPRPVAFLEKRWGPFRSTAYFITDYTPGTQACQWFRAHAKTDSDQQIIIMQFGALLQKLHDALITHGDFKATNFILSENRLIVTDLDAMRAHRWKGGRFRRKFNKDCRRLLQNWKALPGIYQTFSEELKKRGFLPPDG